MAQIKHKNNPLSLCITATAAAKVAAFTNTHFLCNTKMIRWSLKKGGNGKELQLFS